MDIPRSTLQYISSEIIFLRNYFKDKDFTSGANFVGWKCQHLVANVTKYHILHANIYIERAVYWY